MYEVGDIIIVNANMQKGYQYLIEAPLGKKFALDFKPFFSPKKMLALGVFEGKYCNDCRPELPEDWYTNAMKTKVADPSINLFKVKSRQPLSLWREKGWIIGPDPRGWFQWYCRYFMGRRLPEIDHRQIKRWRMFARHAAHYMIELLEGGLTVGSVRC